MTKYQPLEKYLKDAKKRNIPMSFSEIEAVIGDRLPPSARKHRAWWSNNPSNSVITYAWLAAGYKTAAVNLEAEKLVFEKSRPDAGDTPQGGGTDGPHPLFGCLKGLITIPADLDLTQPADPDWGARLHGDGD